MLEYMRKASNTWVFKIFFALLIASFAFFGLGDFGGGGFGTNVAKVGSETISYYEFDRLLKSQMLQARKVVGDNVPMAQLVKMIRGEVMQQLIQQKLLTSLSKEMKLEVSDKIIKEVIAREFSDENGKFNPQKFQTFLHNSGYSEKQFIEIVKGDMTRTFIMDAMFPAIKAPKSLVEPIFKDYYSPRTLQVLTVTEASLPKEAKPTQKELNAFYTEHLESYRQPELRSVEAFVFDPSTRMMQVKAKNPTYTKDEIRQAAIEANHQVVQEVEDKLASGATFEEVSEEFGTLIHTAKAVSEQGRDAHGEDGLGSSMIHPEMLAVAFALEEGVESDVNELKDGRSYIIKVTEVIPTKVPTFEEVKTKVEKDYKQSRKAKALSTAVAAMLEDLNSGKKTLASVAKEVGGVVYTHDDIIVGSKIPASLTQGVVETMSKQPKHKYFTSFAGDKAYIGVVTKVGKPKTENAAENFNKVQDGLRHALVGALYQSFIGALKEDHPVDVNKSLLAGMTKSYEG